MDYKGRTGRKSVSCNRGITFFELLVVMALISILSAIAAPVYSQWSGNIEYRSVARRVFQVLREARSRAIVTCLEHRVEFDPENKRYRVTQGNRNFNSESWNTVIYDWEQCPNNVRLEANVLAIHLNPNGTANAGTISILDDAHKTRYEIKVARTGRMRIPIF